MYYFKNREFQVLFFPFFFCFLFFLLFAYIFAFESQVKRGAGGIHTQSQAAGIGGGLPRAP